MNLRTRIYNQLYPNYYAVIMVMYFLSLFVLTIPRAAIIGIIMLSIDIVLLTKIKMKMYLGEFWVFVYICFCCFTGIRYLSNSVPINVFFASISYSLLPMLFVFMRDREKYIKTIDITFKAIFVSIILAWVLYIIAPPFYGEYLVYHSLSSREDFEWIRAALQGVYGITALGTFSAISGLYFFYRYISEERIKYLIVFGISTITLFFTGRRSAIGAFIVTYALEIFLFIIRGGKKSKRVGYAILVVCLLGGFIVLQKMDEVILILNRVLDISTAINERNSNWKEALNSIHGMDWFIGSGYGSRSHLVANIKGITGVFDNNYLELLLEIGVVGMILFSACILIALFPKRYIIRFEGDKISKQYKDYSLLATLIILVYMIQAIGSNVWEFQILAPLFWMCIGIKIHE